MAFGKKKESREVEGYMKLTPKSALIYLAIIVFCIIVIFQFPSFTGESGISADAFLRIHSGKLQTGIQQHELSDGTDQQYPDNRWFCSLCSDFCYHGSISDRTY